MPPRPFRFLDLPPEIREKIYILASQAPSPILLNVPHAHDFFPLSLLLTNTQIYHELRPLYFTINTFAITLLRRNDTWDYLLSPSFQDNRRQIRSLRLNIVRWGSKNYFVEELMPVLEDCIMNGKLRDLEIRLRDAHLKEGSTDMEGEHIDNWQALMRLMKDPYLERRALLAGAVGGPGFDLRQMPFETVRWMYDFSGEGRWWKLGAAPLSVKTLPNT